jgi:hypothetical protein
MNTRQDEAMLVGPVDGNVIVMDMVLLVLNWKKGAAIYVPEESKLSKINKTLWIVIQCNLAER